MCARCGVHARCVPSFSSSSSSSSLSPPHVSHLIHTPHTSTALSTSAIKAPSDNPGGSAELPYDSSVPESEWEAYLQATFAQKEANRPGTGQAWLRDVMQSLREPQGATEDPNSPREATTADNSACRQPTKSGVELGSIPRWGELKRRRAAVGVKASSARETLKAKVSRRPPGAGAQGREPAAPPSA